MDIHEEENDTTVNATSAPVVSIDIPVRLWGLDPLHRCGIKLFISQLHTLPQVLDFEGVYALYGHPVTRFEIVGCIVRIERKELFIKFGVDDGTGVIQCCVWLNKTIDKELDSHKLGQLVSVCGKLNIFRGNSELRVDRLTLELDPNFEIYHWIEVIKCREIYKRKFDLPKEFHNISADHEQTNG